ncbi:MAG: tyrosine-type recombinase/integrase [Gemmataceae bacterium]
MASAWIYQDDKQIKKLGADRAAWYVGWYDPEGKRRCKSCGSGSQGRYNAEKLRRKIESKLLTGTYEAEGKAKWKDFRAEWERNIGSGMASHSRRLYLTAFDNFERLVNPVRVYWIPGRHIAMFIAKRREDRGKRPGSVVSVATINRDLRHLRAALKTATEWGYLPQAPAFHMLREPGKLPSYITGDHFAAVYAACDKARMPEDIGNIDAADWWRALLVMAYMTGWRIGDMLSVRREDLNLEAGTVLTRWENNKGRRDELVKLHPVVMEQLGKLAGFDCHVFPWNHDRRTLYSEFLRIQQAAGIDLPCRNRDKHKCGPFCHVYGFHDLRRAFATMNADKLTPDALQALMRHKSYITTQKYINMTRQMDAAVASLHVPEVLRSREAK